MHAKKWALIPLLISSLLITPILALFFAPQILSVWTEFNLGVVFLRTLLIAVSACLMAILIAVPTAWLTSVSDIKYKSIFSTLLVLPLSIPSYIYAFVYIGLFDYSSPIARTFRDIGIYLPPIRNIYGLIIVLTLSLFPYIYTVSRSAFLKNAKRTLEVCSSLGHSNTATFFKVILPTSSPWIGQGILLMFLEVFADFGAVSIFNITTLTTTIFTAWYGFFSLDKATSIALFLIIAALFFSIIQHRILTLQSHFKSSTQPGISSLKLTPIQHIFTYIFLISIVFFTLCLPSFQLLFWVTRVPFSFPFFLSLLPAIQNTIIIALITTIIIITLSLIYTISLRFSGKYEKLLQNLTPLAMLGYGIPGTVLAVACYRFLGQTLGLGAMIMAYSIRYFPLLLRPINAAYQSIPKKIDHIAFSLKTPLKKLLQEIHFPYLKQTLFSASAICVIDIAKEMPIALMTRPFGWDTLAVKLFTYTEEGLWEIASLPAILLVSISVISTLLLKKEADK